MANRVSLTATQHELPFSQLSWEQFERLCLRLIRARGYKRVEHLGRSGNEQGRDIAAWDEDTRVAVQCKRVQKFSADDGLRELAKLRALDESSRPRRVIFMVTCSISAHARDVIRRAWLGNEESCEFVASTELDAEVRSNKGILNEFFQMPGLISVFHERHHGKATEEQLEAQGEVGRIESANQEWVISARSFHFQRLLQAIKEVEPLAGRLEAGRALNQAVQRSGAGTTPKAQNLIRLLDQLDSSDLFQLNWKLHRVLARVVGDVVGLQFEGQHRRLVGRFCEPRLYTREGVLLLAEAASEHTAAASAIGEAVLHRLLLSTQPQARWQLLRRWPLVSPVVSSGIELNEIREVNNAGIRRMLFLTQLLRARHSQKHLRELLRSATEGVSGEPGDPANVHFERALTAWTVLNTSVDMPNRTVWRGALFRIHELLQVVIAGGDQGGDLTGDIALALELDGIERDLRNAEGAYQPHPSEKYTLGRYGYTRHYVRWALRAVPRDGIGSLLTELLNCADEGIRWALAAEVLNWWTLVPDVDAATDAVLQLVRDMHPWVVREVLQQLAADPLLCQSIGIPRLTRSSRESLARIEAEGWVTGELAVAIRSIATLAPARAN